MSLDLKTDLHLHTTASDGTWRPEKLYVFIRRITGQLLSIAWKYAS
jgi:predicted metal-dependent phosphoesterase TrpH